MNTFLKKSTYTACLLIVALLVLLPAAPSSAQVQRPEKGSGMAVPGTPLQPEEAMQVDFRSQLGGTSMAVAVSGNLAYVGIGPRLVVLDISEPTKPVEVGKTAVLPGVIEDIALYGKFALIAASGSGLRVIDISDPFAPEEIGYAVTPSYAYGVTVSGDYAFVADYHFGLRIFDMTDPGKPVEVGFYDTPGYAWDVAVSGKFTYVADDIAGLRIIYVGDLTQPVEVGFYDTPGYAQGVTVSGDLAFVADGTFGLRVIDIYNPEGPFEIGSYDTVGYANSVTLSSSFAFIADGNSGLLILSIFDPSKPAQVGYCDTPGSSYNLAISGSYAYVADYFTGLRIIDIYNPEFPKEAAFYDQPGNAEDVAVSGSYAYIADGTAGLRIINIANPANPVMVGFYDTPGYASGVAVAGSYAYVADYHAGLRIIDITNKTSPWQVGYYDSNGFSQDVAVSGNFAYVADYGVGLRIINITNKAAPVVAGSCATPGDVRGVAISGSYAYIADGESGLRVINVSNPASPVAAGFFDTSGYAYNVAVSGSYAYLADGGPGLRIINVSNPNVPAETGFYNTPGYAFGVVVSGSYAYIADSNSGLRIVNISTPAAPASVGYHDTSGYAYGVAVSSSYVYIADSSGGLFVFQACLIPETPVLLDPVNGTLTNNSSLIFDWKAANYATVYQFQMDVSSNFTSPLVNMLVTDTNNTPGFPFDSTFYWHVRAINEASGCSVPGAYSTAWAVTVDTTPPPVPTLLAPAPDYSTNDTTPAFSWSTPSGSGVVQYQIQADMHVGFISPEINQTTSATSFTPATALAYNTYVWHVRARDDAGNWSSYSKTDLFTILPAPAAFDKLAPSDGLTHVPDDQDLLLSWQTSIGATIYEYCIDKTNDYACSSGWIDIGNNTSVLLNNLQKATTYYWQVRSSNADVDVFSDGGVWWKFSTVVPPVYLPLVVRNFSNYFEGPNEVEPNNDKATANGPIRSGQNYTGTLGDANDYFSFETKAAGVISVVLEHTGSGVQLQLYDADLHQLGHAPGSSPLVINTSSIPVGWYYVRVYTDPVGGSYTLNVTYP